MAKVTQLDLYNIQVDSHTLRLIDHAICAYKDKLLKDQANFTSREVELGYSNKLESLHEEVLRVLRDGHA